MTEFIKDLSTWVAPPLFAAVLWLVIKKFEHIDKRLDKYEEKAEKLLKDTSDKISKSESNFKDLTTKITDDIGKAIRQISDVQIDFRNELKSVNTLTIRMEAQIININKWLEESRQYYGKIIDLDRSVEKHTDTLGAAGKLLKNHSERIREVEKKIK